MKSERKTIFNIIYSGIVDLFNLSVAYLTANSKYGIRYDWYKTKTHPNSDNFNLFMDEFMAFIKQSYREESMLNAKDFLEGLFSCLVKAKRNNGIACSDIHAHGTYDDIECLLEQAYYAISDMVEVEEVYPNVHFDSRLLTPAQCFFGRDEFVQDIITQLADRRIYLWGLGGIGKTEVVKAVVNTILNRHVGFGNFVVRDIYWIAYDNGNSSEDVKDCVIKSVKPQTDITDGNRDELYEKCISTLNKRQTLLIVDNVELFNEELSAFINRIQNAYLLVAGRPLSEDRGTLHGIEVKELDLNACMRLFSFYCPFSESERADVERIVELADRHTVTLELMARLIRVQEKTISEFLHVLVECGFNFRFEGEKEEKVISSHSLMAKEDRIICQLAKLFNTVRLTGSEKMLLIKFSAVPNLKCATQNACKWFALSDTSALYSLSNAGWLKREEGERNKHLWYIHNIIASAVRFAYSDILLQTCQPFIDKLTDVMYNMLEQNKRPNKMLIQFGWAISDIFNGRFKSVNDVNFLYVLSGLYERIGLLQRSAYIVKLAMELADQISN